MVARSAALSASDGRYHATTSMSCSWAADTKSDEQLGVVEHVGTLADRVDHLEVERADAERGHVGDRVGRDRHRRALGLRRGRVVEHVDPRAEAPVRSDVARAPRPRAARRTTEPKTAARTSRSGSPRRIGPGYAGDPATAPRPRDGSRREPGQPARRHRRDHATALPAPRRAHARPAPRRCSP